MSAKNASAAKYNNSFRQGFLVEVVDDYDLVWVGKRGVIVEVIPHAILKDGSPAQPHSHPYLVSFPDNTTRWFAARELKLYVPEWEDNMP